MAKKYTLYIDESGTATIGQRKPKKTHRGSPFFVLAGIIVESTADSEMAAYMNHIKRRYDLADGESFHAVNFFEGHRLKKKGAPHGPKAVSAAKAKKISDSLGEFLTTFPIQIKVVALNKNDLRRALKFPENYGFKGSKEHKEDKEVGYEILARELFFWFSRFLKTHKAVGRIVAESRRAPDVVIFKTFLTSGEPNNFLERKMLLKWSQAMKNHVASIAFENKKGVQCGLEIADIASYISHDYLKGILSEFEHRGSKIVWTAIRKKLEGKKIHQLRKAGFERVAPDRIHKIATTIRNRLDNVFDNP